MALAAYVTDATVDVCAHGIYVHDDHCTDAYVVDRNERFFRANDWDGARVAFDHRAVRLCAWRVQARFISPCARRLGAAARRASAR